MEKLNYEGLFLIRHGEAKDRRLSERGKTQVKELIGLVNPNIVAKITPFSSTERRAIETALVLMDGLKYLRDGREWPACLESLWTHSSLYGEGITALENFINFANKNKSTKNCLAVTHLEFMHYFPKWFLREFFQKDFSGKFDYTEGIYIDLKTGEYKNFNLGDK
ncbi:MAG: phosphoglycerate mutase family protein [Nanoarchaeota archaeon]